MKLIEQLSTIVVVMTKKRNIEGLLIPLGDMNVPSSNHGVLLKVKQLSIAISFSLGRTTNKCLLYVKYSVLCQAHTHIYNERKTNLS